MFFLKTFFALFLCFTPIIIFSQTGCTDHNANNFNLLAKTNDGSCTYVPFLWSSTLKGTITSVPESSGLIFSDGKLWTFGDSGNPAAIYSIDTASARVKQVVSITNYPNVDWEDITADKDYLYISDLGNNDGNRKDLKILKIAKADIGDSQYPNVKAEAISISYADQTDFSSNGKTNFDCEAIFSKGDSLYIFTKDRGDFQTRVYKVSKSPGSYVLSPYTSFNVNGKITGADYNPKTNEVALIGYMGSDYNSFIWLLSDFQGDHFFSGNKRRIEIGKPNLSWQTEGIAYIDSGKLFISCETTSDFPSSLYTLDRKDIKSSVVNATDQVKAPSSNIQVYPNPAKTNITIESKEEIKQLSVYNLAGDKIYETSVHQTSYLLNLGSFNFNEGLHVVKIETGDQSISRSLILIK